MSAFFDDDPLAGGESRPALSFKDKPIGTVYRGRIIEAPKSVQSRDFETGDPATWPDGNPKMSVVIGLDVDGEEVSLWAAKPSAMLSALRDAQQKAGARLAVGGTLAVKFTGETPNKKNPRLNPQKLYAAQYTAPDALGGDPFDLTAPATLAAAPAQQQAFTDEPPF